MMSRPSAARVRQSQRAAVADGELNQAWRWTWWRASMCAMATRQTTSTARGASKQLRCRPYTAAAARSIWSSPSAATEAAAASSEPTATAAEAAAATTARPVTTRPRSSGTIEVARPLCAIHARAAIAIQLCGRVTAQTALCSTITRLPCGANGPIDIGPAAIVVFLPAPALVAVDVAIAAGIHVSGTRSANCRVALRPTTSERFATATALCDSTGRAGGVSREARRLRPLITAFDCG